MNIYAQFLESGMMASILKIVYIFIVIFGPIAFAMEFWKSWIKYTRAKFIAAQPVVVLELLIPRGEAKSPLAMELFITALHQTGGESTWYDRYILGKNRPWFSLELVSIEGTIHFFIWTRDRWRGWIESQLYAQFPDIEIRRVDDYAAELNFNLDEYNMWGADYIKKEPSHIPIRTYVGYGLDKDPEEEFKVDPLTPLLELLGSFGKGEQYWLQIGVRAHKKEITKPGTWFEKVDWTHAAKEDIKKLMQRDKKPKEGEIVIRDLSMTKGEKEKVEAIEKNLSKLAFDCVIRGIYVAKKDVYNGPMGGVLAGLMRPFNAPNLNTFGPSNTVDYDYPWYDFWGRREQKNKYNLMKVYKERSFFFKEYFPRKANFWMDPLATTLWSEKYKIAPLVMTTEELATIYHFPGDVARTPSLMRVTAKKAEPPANLPI